MLTLTFLCWTWCFFFFFPLTKHSVTPSVTAWGAPASSSSSSSSSWDTTLPPCGIHNTSRPAADTHPSLGQEDTAGTRKCSHGSSKFDADRDHKSAFSSFMNSIFFDQSVSCGAQPPAEALWHPAAAGTQVTWCVYGQPWEPHQCVAADVLTRLLLLSVCDRRHWGSPSQHAS